jgi:hypothetical protein
MEVKFMIKLTASEYAQLHALVRAGAWRPPLP